MGEEDRKEMDQNRVHLRLRPMAQVYTSYKEYKNKADRDIRAVTIGRFISCHVEYKGGQQGIDTVAVEILGGQGHQH